MCEYEYEYESCVYRSDFIKWFKSLFGWKHVRQAKLIVDGKAIEGETVYKQQFIRELQQPYDVKYKLQEGKISGFSCTPVSAEINTPEYDVVEGGINYDHVHIRLTPHDGGQWGCVIHICAALK